MLFALTVAPDDGHQWINSSQRLYDVVNHLRCLTHHTLKEKDSHYECYVEISHPQDTRQGQCARIHIHGWVEWTPTQCNRFYANRLHKLNKNASVCIKPILTEDDFEKWDEYIKKQQADMIVYAVEEGTISKWDDSSPVPREALPKAQSSKKRSKNGAFQG